jgi:hypothetical protein
MWKRIFTFEMTNHTIFNVSFNISPRDKRALKKLKKNTTYFYNRVKEEKKKAVCLNFKILLLLNLVLVFSILA